VSRDLTTPLLRWFAIHGLVLATINIRAKFEISISSYYEHMKREMLKKCDGLSSQESLKFIRNNIIR